MMPLTSLNCRCVGKETIIHPYHHALSSVRRWGGTVADYMAVHQFFDESKSQVSDVRHRALRHHAEGIFLCERIFGPTITISTGRVIPTRFIGEQHVKEDLGWIPALKDWFENIQLQPWMLRGPVQLPERAGQGRRKRCASARQQSRKESQ